MPEQLVVFTLHEEEFALPVTLVREITRIDEVINVPDSPPYIKGIINLRGKAIPVVDIHNRLGLSSSHCRVALISEVNGITIGLTVDGVKEVSTLGEVQAPPTMMCSQFVTGIINIPPRMVMVLDLDSLIGSDDQVVLTRIAEKH